MVKLKFTAFWFKNNAHLSIIQKCHEFTPCYHKGPIQAQVENNKT